MIYWAMEYRVGRGGWTIDHRTIRKLRRDAIQAPLDLEPTDEFWLRYDKLRRDGAVRPVKIRLVRCPC